ncbi:MAG: flagellar biosynthesis protein FlhB, partial [Proteobacteria bacterium]
SWWKLEKKMRMSSQELKDEAKDAQGDSRIKGRRRKFARQCLRRH